MPVQISGVLKDGTGKLVPGCTIELKALRTTETVIVNQNEECIARITAQWCLR